jgi:DNA invertase Pin-like site-specific DNA recombinase
MNPHPKQVVAYCRVSTLEQKRRGYGIDIQILDVTRFAEGPGLRIERFYKDEAQSGVLETRQELRRLLLACRKGQIGTVIIPNLERLSRNVRVAENLFHEFERLGVRVLIADMPSYNALDRKDVMIRQIREAIAEENRKDIIERLWKGRRARVERGSTPGGTLAYGYRRDGKSVVIDDSEGTIVRTIFALSIDGASGVQIAARLNGLYFRRRNGKPWTQRQVAAILARRELYVHGIFRYGDVLGRDPALAVA